MTDTVPCRELRLGIVLYGGVSLAIYMAGITEELHALLRASRDRSSSTPSPVKAPNPAPTSAIYRDLLDELAKETVDLRVVVDTIAGSSAAVRLPLGGTVALPNDSCQQSGHPHCRFCVPNARLDAAHCRST